MTRLNRWVRVFLRFCTCLRIPDSDLNHNGFGDYQGDPLSLIYTYVICIFLSESELDGAPVLVPFQEECCVYHIYTNGSETSCSTC